MMPISRSAAAAVLAALLPLPPLFAAVWDEPDAQRLQVGDTRLAVHGLGWFPEQAPALSRLPVRSKAEFPPRAWSLAQTPAGVRLRFSTDAERIGLLAKHPAAKLAPHVIWLGQAAADLHVDGVLLGSAAPDKDGRLTEEWFTGKAPARRAAGVGVSRSCARRLQCVRLL